MLSVDNMEKDREVKTGRAEAHAFFNFAQQYHYAATTLLPIGKSVESPIYFLFAHTVELAFKAYLNLYKPYNKRIHSLETLLSECVKNGLPIRRDIRNVIQYLESENSLHGFRYFLLASTIKPELNYLSEGVSELIKIVSSEMAKAPIKTPSKAAVFKFTISKPQQKK